MRRRGAFVGVEFACMVLQAEANASLLAVAVSYLSLNAEKTPKFTRVRVNV